MTDRSTCTAPRHDPTESAYKVGCRCPDTTAHRARLRNARRTGTHIPPFVAATATAHRIRILIGIGHGWTTIAAHVGCRPWDLRRLLTQTVVHRTTGTVVGDTFARLVKESQPYGYAASKAVGTAMRNGWGFVDLVAVRKVLQGNSATLTKYERLAVVYIGHAEGVTNTALASMAHFSLYNVRNLTGETPCPLSPPPPSGRSSPSPRSCRTSTAAPSPPAPPNSSPN